MVLAVGRVSVAAVPLARTERGGLELAGHVVGLAGLALLCEARLAWILPRLWAPASYFVVTRT